MADKLIYVIEDEQDIAELIKVNLSLHSYKVEIFHSGEVGFKKILEVKPDLLLLDLMLPGMSGLEICKRVKATPGLETLPIIMVTAKGEEGDVVNGLEMGADDYITKPFSIAILCARVDVLLRRGRPRGPVSEQFLKRGAIEIDPGKVEVFVLGQRVDLTQSEFKILHFLAQRPGWVFTRGQIVEAIRGENYAVTDRTIDFQMVGLRKKLGENGDMIETVRGVGYRFKEDKSLGE